jgi:hypothetical protein
VTTSMGCRVIGRWRIAEANIWERDYLDLVEPATMVIGADDHGEIAFGALQAGLDLAYGRSDVVFTFVGSDEMDEVRGSGSAELLEDGTLEIELDFEHGDDAILRAQREDSSDAVMGGPRRMARSVAVPQVEGSNGVRRGGPKANNGRQAWNSMSASTCRWNSRASA